MNFTMNCLEKMGEKSNALKFKKCIIYILLFFSVYHENLI